MPYTNSDVNSWYQLVQYRDGPRATVESYVELLNSHVLFPEDVKTAIVNDSFTFSYVNPVARLYQAALARVPDASGWNYYTDAYSSGYLTSSNIAENLANSPEFMAIYGVGAWSPINAAVLTAFYWNVLGRAPDLAGFDYWLNSGQSTCQVLNQFAQSPEFKSITDAALKALNYDKARGAEIDSSAPLSNWNEPTKTDTLEKLFIAYFGRAGDPAGLEYWVKEASKPGSNFSDIAQSFSAQEEAKSLYGFLRAPSLGLGQEDFLKAVYQNLFERSIDNDGLAYWKDQLNNGRSVGPIILDIINGAQGTDKTTLMNKLSVAKYYTENVINSNATWTVDDDLADARAVIADVTSSSSTVTAGKTLSDRLIDADKVPVGSSLTLTTSVDAVSGTQKNDTISGIIGASGTYNVGDNISGGAGTDTLNLIDAGSATSAPFVSMSGVEIVNVRMLSAGTTIINANDWEGVVTLTNASSVAGSTLNATGVSTTTSIKVYDDSDVNVAFKNSTTASSVSLTLVSVGTGNTASTIGSASAAATANIDLDLNNSGLLAEVSVSVEGSVNIARLEAGSNVASYTITGSGNASLVTDDTITSFNATAALGNLDVTFSGASDVTAVGGAGNDTFNFGTTISNGDSVNGGGGIDTIGLTIVGFNRSLHTTGVEVTNATFNDDAGGTLNATGSTVATYSLRAGSAGADAIAAGVAAGATINLTTNANDLDDVSVGYASGAASGIVNLGSATGAVALDVLTVTGVSNLAVNSVAGSAGAAVSIASVNFGGAALSITTIGGEADLAITNLTADALTTLIVTSNGSAGFTLTSGLEANTALTSVTVVAQGSDAADVILGGINSAGLAHGFNSLVLAGTSGADIELDTIQMGNGATATFTATIAMAAGNGSVIGSTAMDMHVSGAVSLTLNLSAEASGTICIGDILLVAGTASTAAISATDLAINPVLVGANGLVTIDRVQIHTTAGAVLTVGQITVGTSAGFVLGSAGIQFNNILDGRISDIAMTLGVDASGTFGAISITDGAVGNIGLSLADSASASFGNILTSAMGDITLTLEGDSEADFARLEAGGDIGDITLSVEDDADATFGVLHASGDIGNIILSIASGATVNFAEMDAQNIGDIKVSGAGVAVFAGFWATRVGTIDASGMASAGSLNVNLAGVANGVTVDGGNGTLVVQSSDGNDTFNLKSGAGDDTIRFGATGQAADVAYRFEMGTGGDVIGLSVTGLDMLNGSGDAIDASAAAVVDVTVVTAGGTSLAATDNIVVIKATAFASLAEMVSSISKTAGDHALDLVAGASSNEAGGLAIVWSDGVDSYLSLVEVANASAGVLNNASANTLITFAGVNITGVNTTAVAANFAFFTT